MLGKHIQKLPIIQYAKQKHLGCKKVQGLSEATCKQAGVTISFDISQGQEVTLSKNF